MSGVAQHLFDAWFAAPARVHGLLPEFSAAPGPPVGLAHAHPHLTSFVPDLQHVQQKGAGSSKSRSTSFASAQDNQNQLEKLRKNMEKINKNLGELEDMTQMVIRSGDDSGTVLSVIGHAVRDMEDTNKDLVHMADMLNLHLNEQLTKTEQEHISEVAGGDEGADGAADATLEKLADSAADELA